MDVKGEYALSYKTEKTRINWFVFTILIFRIHQKDQCKGALKAAFKSFSALN